MENYSIGGQRNRGAVYAFCDRHWVSPPRFVETGDGKRVQFEITTDRREFLNLKPEEVVAGFLALPPEEMVRAVAKIGKTTDLSEQLPEVVKQLVGVAFEMVKRTNTAKVRNAS